MGRTFLYKEKAPFVDSGESVLGALEFDQESDSIKCHKCGGWFKSLGNHLTVAHRTTAAEYKRAHGLNARTALVCEGLRKHRTNLAISQTLAGKGIDSFNRTDRGRELQAKRRVGGLPGRSQNRKEACNMRGTCQAQLLDRIKRIVSIVGHTPTAKEFMDHGLSIPSCLHTFNLKKLSELLGLIGLVANKPGTRRIPDVVLINMLRDFWAAHRRLPAASDIRRGLMVCQSTLRIRFGSLENAYAQAGILIRKEVRGRATKWVGYEKPDATGNVAIHAV